LPNLAAFSAIQVREQNLPKFWQIEAEQLFGCGKKGFQIADWHIYV